MPLRTEHKAGAVVLLVGLVMVVGIVIRRSGGKHTEPDAAPAASAGEAAAPAPGPAAPPAPWKNLKFSDFAALPIDDMPPDSGTIAPIAEDGEEPAESGAQAL